MDSLQPGRVIRDARMARGLSQSALATRAGTTQDAVSRIERGAEEPSIERLRRVLLCLGLRPEITITELIDHEVDSRRLAETARMSPQERLDQALAAQRLVGAIDSAVAAIDR